MTKRSDISPSGSRWECRKFSSLAFLLLYDKCLLDEEVKRPAIELHPGLCPKLFASLPRTGIPSVATADAFRKELCSVRWSPLDACSLEGLGLHVSSLKASVKHLLVPNRYDCYPSIWDNCWISGRRRLGASPIWRPASTLGGLTLGRLFHIQEALSLNSRSVKYSFDTADYL